MRFVNLVLNFVLLFFVVWWVLSPTNIGKIGLINDLIAGIFIFMVFVSNNMAYILYKKNQDVAKRMTFFAVGALGLYIFINFNFIVYLIR